MNEQTKELINKLLDIIDALEVNDEQLGQAMFVAPVGILDEMDEVTAAARRFLATGGKQ